MKTGTISSKGQIVIPAPIRKRLDLQEGSKVSIEERNGTIVVQPLSVDPIEESFGCLRGEPSLVEMLLRERNEEQTREQRNTEELVEEGFGMLAGEPSLLEILLEDRRKQRP